MEGTAVDFDRYDDHVEKPKRFGIGLGQRLVVAPDWSKSSLFRKVPWARTAFKTAGNVWNRLLFGRYCQIMSSRPFPLSPG